VCRLSIPTLSFAGAFHYYITVVGEGGKVALPADSVGDGYFLVEPELVCRGLNRSVDSVVCQTVLSKLMGPLDTWEVGKALGSREVLCSVHVQETHSQFLQNVARLVLIAHCRLYYEIT
jgi:hypothetical protein